MGLCVLDGIQSVDVAFRIWILGLFLCLNNLSHISAKPQGLPPKRLCEYELLGYSTVTYSVFGFHSRLKICSSTTCFWILS